MPIKIVNKVALSGLLMPILLSKPINVSAELENIIVSAQKRPQLSSEVGITMMVFDNNIMEDIAITDFSELAQNVPNMMAINNDLAGLPSYRIRGIGLNEFQASFESPVGVTIDNIYFSKTFLASNQVYDVEQIEVLKGPQSILYGRNTIGGSVNYSTNKPTEEFQAGINVRYGNYENLRSEGYVSGPISSSLLGRFSFMTNNASIGPYINQLNNERLGEQDKYAARGQITWLGDSTKIYLNIHGAIDKGELPPYGNELLRTNAAVPSSFTVNQDYSPLADNSSYGGYVRLERQLSNSKFISISALESFERDQREDTDNSPARTVNVDWYAVVDQITQELRLEGNLFNSNLYSMFGFYFEYSDLEEIDSFDFSDNAFLIGLFGTPSARLATEFNEKSTALAFYTNQEFNLTSKTSLNLGLRYSYDKTSFNGRSFVGSANTVGRKNRTTPISIVDNKNVDRDDNDISFRLGLDYKPSKDLILYSTISSGFHRGGYDLGFAQQLVEFEDEKAMSYELGLKSYLFSNVLSINAALFLTEIDNYQSNVDFVGSVVPRRTNIGNLMTRGGELDILWEPIHNFQLSTSFGYNDAEISSNNTVSGILIDGNKPVNTPEFSSSGYARYTYLINKDISLAGFINYNWIGERYLEIQNQKKHLARSYYTVDTRFSLLSNDNTWDISVWGKNITNQQYLRYANDNPPLFFLTVNGEPATYGLEANIYF